MARGRRPDHPDEQRAKGGPGRRPGKVARAKEVAALLSIDPEDADNILTPPSQLKLPSMTAALVVWREYAPKLHRRNVLAETDRHTLMTFCIAIAEYVTAQKDITDSGYAIEVKTVSGDKMKRINPSVRRRDNAFGHILELSKRFGLSPADRFGLINSQRSVLGGGAAPELPLSQGAPRPEETSEPASPIGALTSFDSPPPGRVN